MKHRAVVFRQLAQATSRLDFVASEAGGNLANGWRTLTIEKKRNDRFVQARSVQDKPPYWNHHDALMLNTASFFAGRELLPSRFVSRSFLRSSIT